MKNKTTELVFLLDRSGSMSGLEDDTIGGFNAMIAKQKEKEGACLVSTVLFDHVAETLHDRVKLSKVAPMTRQDYVPGGSTALIDAIGGAIHHIDLIHRYARPEDVPAHTLFVITTDGQENASCHYTADEVKQLIEQRKKRSEWEFLFLGANIDAVETASRFGIGADRAVTYCNDSDGIDMNFCALNGVISAVRESRPLSIYWKKGIEEDVKRR